MLNPSSRNTELNDSGLLENPFLPIKLGIQLWSISKSEIVQKRAAIPIVVLHETRNEWATTIKLMTSDTKTIAGRTDGPLGAPVLEARTNILPGSES